MPTWLTIFLALGGSTLIALVVQGIAHLISERGKRKAREIEEAVQEKRQRERIQEMRDVIKEEVNPIKGQVDSIAQMVNALQTEDISVLKEANKDSLRNQLYILYDRCYLYKTDDDIENEAHMFKSYTALNGNSGCHARHNIFLQLPTEAQFAHEHPEEYKKIKSKGE